MKFLFIDLLFLFHILFLGDKYNQSFTNNVYKVHMKLTILAVEMSDYETYKCISKNSLGETNGSIKLYRKYTLYFIIHL